MFKIYIQSNGPFPKTLLISSEDIMPTLQSIQDDLSVIGSTLDTQSEGLDRIAAEIQSLKDQVASGGVVTQAELDNLGDVVTGIKNKATELLTREQDL